MPIATVISLIAQVGLPLAQQLLAIWEASPNKTVGSADLAILEAYGRNTSDTSLAGAGIKIVGGKVVPV